jgi:hypothetical protein
MLIKHSAPYFRWNLAPSEKLCEFMFNIEALGKAAKFQHLGLSYPIPRPIVYLNNTGGGKCNSFNRLFVYDK